MIDTLGHRWRGNAALKRSILATLALVAGMAAVFVWNAYRDYQEVLASNLARDRVWLHAVEQSVNASLRTSGRLLSTAYAAGAGNPGQQQLVATTLRDGLKLIEEGLGFEVRAADGRVLIHDGIRPAPEAKAKLDEHWAAVLAGSGLQLSRPFLLADGGHALLLTQRFPAQDGKPAVAVSVALKVAHFAPILASVLESPSSAATLVNTEGDILLRLPNPENYAGKNIKRPGSHFSQHLASGEVFTSHRGVTAADGIDRISAAKTLTGAIYGNSPVLVVGLTQLSGELLEEWRRETWQNGLFMAALTLFGILLVWLNYGRALQNERSRQFMQAITDSAAAMVIGVDRGGSIQVFNAKAAKVTGIAEDEALGQGYDELRRRVPALPVLRTADDAPSGEGGKGTRTESRFRAGDGKDYEIAWTTLAGHGDEHAIAYSIAMGEDITARRQVEASLRESEQKLTLHLQQTILGIIEWDTDFRVVEWNPAAEKIFGYTRDEALGRHAKELILTPEIISLIEPILTDLLSNTGGTYSSNDNVTKAGKTISCEWFNTALTDDAGKVFGVISLVRDVTAQKTAEERIQAALNEKEVLLKEIYHRVKNNLQVVASLLTMQARAPGDESPQALLTQSASRVKSIALVHEQLYRSGNLASIDFSAYAAELVGNLMETHRPLSDRVKVHLDVAPVKLGIDTAIPLGLITNELVSNAFKHAFNESNDGTIDIELQPCDDGKLCLTVIDSGSGLPAGFAIERSTSLGMRLVQSLTHQLDGRLALENDGGAKFSITFGLDG